MIRSTARRITITMPARTLRDIRKLAAIDRVSISEYMRRLAEEKLKNERHFCRPDCGSEM